MKNISNIPSMLSIFISQLAGKYTVKKKMSIRPVENEELFDHLFID